MRETLLFIGAGFALAWGAWKTGWAGRGAGLAADAGRRVGAWLGSDAGTWSPLAHELTLREVHAEGLECAGGWIWTGAELTPAATDGLSNAETNRLGAMLNRAAAGMAANTRLHTVTRVGETPTATLAALEERLDAGDDAVWHALGRARLAHLRAEAAVGRARATRTLLVVGRQMAARGGGRMAGRGLLGAGPWAEATAAEFGRAREECLAARATAVGFLTAAGVGAREVSGAELYAWLYGRLNPERARTQPPPGAAGDGNPREALCMTSAEIDRGGVIWWGATASATIALKRLPVRLTAVTLEGLTRAGELDFPFEVSAHCLVEDFQRRDEKLETAQRYLTNAVEQQRVVNPDEALKLQNVAAARAATRAGEEKFAQIGFGVTVFAPDAAELRRRTDALLAALRRCEGMEGFVDRHDALRRQLATLPGHAPLDGGTKLELTRTAAALQGWTGGPAGLPPGETRLVFQRPDGGIFGWDTASPRFRSGMAVVCGGTGTGKSTLLAYLATDLLAAGRRGVILDYGGSYHRLACAAVGAAAHIDVGDVRRTHGLGLLDIAPHPGETFAATDYDADGLLIARFQAVTAALERLCLDPRGAETALPPRLVAHLQARVRLAYLNAAPATPTLDAVIRTLRQARDGERADGAELADRLAVYAGRGPFARFFTAPESAAAPADAALTVFDFRSVRNDARLTLLATLAVEMRLSRFVASGRGVPKFFIADELNEIARAPAVAATIDSLFRTARKNGVVCLAGSQKPDDFLQESLRALAVNAEVKWLYEMPVGLATEAFNLSVGQAAALARVTTVGPDWRDCLLLSPLGTAHLRLRLAAADRRLCAGATTGAERISVAAAADSVPGEIPDRLRAAWAADGLGERSPAVNQPGASA
jgi:hypothetical protein